jgi:multidrug efflux pump subunit AcrA (membrane-fusion protein)
MLRKFGIIAVLSLLLIAVTAAVATAAVRFHAGPTCTDQGLTLNCTGNVSGLGQEPLTVTISSPATATTTCTNPAGNVAPGQTFTFIASGTQTVQVDKNWRATFNLTTPTPTPPAGSCPNPKWTANVTDVTFGTVTLTGTQGGQTVFQRTVTPS